jgi:uncharacterized membrane protein YphA (DoxX/SURF4 family)
MNERTLRDRLHALAPLILRLGVAAVLAQHGLHRATPLVVGPAADAANTTAAEPRPIGDPHESAVPETTGAAAASTGFTLSGNGGALLGVGELAAAALLAAGVFTRLCTLPILAILGYSMARTQGWLSLSPALGWSDDTTSLVLLAVACFSLLVCGGGCASWDSLIWTRRRKRQGAAMVA